MEYYVHLNGEQKGPYTRDEIQITINKLILTHDTLIWSAEYGDWKPLRDTDFDLSPLPQSTPGNPASISININNTNIQHIFFHFIRPYLHFIDSGSFFKKPFLWLYTAMAIIQLIIPLVIFFAAVKAEVFKIDLEVTFAFLIFWLVATFAGWVSFQLWWDRRSKITFSADKEAEFVATPVLAHYIQTLGEWLGTYIAIIGFSSALVTTLFLGSSRSSLGDFMPPGMGFVGAGALGLIGFPLIGFFIVVIFRFFSEQIKALSVIANNTGIRKQQENNDTV